MANYKKKSTFRWTLFQDFDSGALFDEAERSLQSIFDDVTFNKRGVMSIPVVKLFPDYNIAGERMEGYRAKILVMGEMSNDDQNTVYTLFKKQGWHF